jgi:hypothetical protein
MRRDKQDKEVRLVRPGMRKKSKENTREQEEEKRAVNSRSRQGCSDAHGSKQ